MAFLITCLSVSGFSGLYDVVRINHLSNGWNNRTVMLSPGAYTPRLNLNRTNSIVRRPIVTSKAITPDPHAARLT